MEVKARDLSKRSFESPSADVKIWFKLSMKLEKSQPSFFRDSKDATYQRTMECSRLEGPLLHSRSSFLLLGASRDSANLDNILEHRNRSMIRLP